MAASVLAIPSITEDDLLAFQYSHFGDESKPENWFVDAETAFNVHSAVEEEAEDEALGYYEDGVKRTLTDEQIAMFRHSEIEELLRERRLQREEEEYQNRDIEAEQQHAPLSPGSDASSLEGDLVGLAVPEPKRPSRPSPKQQPSHSSRSDTSRSSGSRKKRRRKEVPYDQRHKRKWERYIEDEDPMEGSRTHRRIVREMDDQAAEKLDVDYGEDTSQSTKQKPSQPAVASGRRVVSYNDFD